jgi:hypothetical protein
MPESSLSQSLTETAVHGFHSPCFRTLNEADALLEMLSTCQARFACQLRLKQSQWHSLKFTVAYICGPVALATDCTWHSHCSQHICALPTVQQQKTFTPPYASQALPAAHAQHSQATCVWRVWRASLALLLLALAAACHGHACCWHLPQQAARLLLPHLLLAPLLLLLLPSHP